MDDKYILEMQDIVKEFPGVKALNGVQLKVRPGTVHTLMGENGAGKSTLVKCLIGMQPVTSGKIRFKGNEVSYKTTQEALDAGISMIHQELSPVLERTVCENIFLGREPKKGIFIDYKKMHKDCIELFEKIGLMIDPREKMKNLTVAKMQMVEIVKAISYDASIVIMDEPTSALTDTEVEDLFKIIAELKAKGVAIIYISHKMEEIFRISDDISVYRDGEYITTDVAKNLTQDKVIELMVGREITDMFPKKHCEIGEVVLEVKELCSGKAVRNVSFNLRRGEILGFAGLVGAGRTETMETIFGMRKRTGGKVYKDGQEINIKSPEDAIKNRIGMLTEDRRGNGIVGILSIKMNTVLAHLKSYGFPVNAKKMAEDTKAYVERLGTKTPTIETPIGNLSGGNQQKVLLARWLLTDPDILIVDEPTRGIDVGAKAEIHTILSELAGMGKAIIVVSSELPEVLGVADRVVVMREGVVTGCLNREEVSQELVMKYATLDKSMQKAIQ
ncbi:sugar ABC transporter ATP-binding protein [Ohessyouella blattaphilus]|uniref:Ribose/galactose/methyl galactoside import ATP-binding protein n=1 Tax=Ohessyouella blattaphilus TaxID=2949333 RepID=A0ABT1EFC2_9FIRM|nr:sugar ABC transporter ATP-binding protein [Ohessyouella blattaphilus]MCP1109390.1 sugar ABC transporter ATP-binding protein [Ohessyouella blattaphilus]MCR8562784.1 sugar ABC transporter ATP-binding protein [Ohessyouella blattaphilus]MDL2249305.1 sugar ABC transporter ATP-binding protein [Lachnospiraceae bacterium OttesenSCG-928-J05]